jgi:hypothetical protein
MWIVAVNALDVAGVNDRWLGGIMNQHSILYSVRREFVNFSHDIGTSHIPVVTV